MIQNELKSLLEVEPTEMPVLSVYVNFEPELEGGTNEQGSAGDPPPLRSWRRRETPRQREFRPGIVEIRNLLADHEKDLPATGQEGDSFRADRDRILDYLNDEADTSAQGIAIFASSGADLWRVVTLPVPVPTQLFVDRVPHINPLAFVLDAHDSFVLCLADSTSARIYVVTMGDAEREETVKGPVINYKMTGGLSQRRIQERITNAVSRHMREVAARVAEIVRDEDIPWIVLAGDAIMLAGFRNHLPERLWGRVVEVSSLDTKTPAHEAIERSLESVAQAERSDAREVEQRALAAAVSGGPGAAGTEAVSTALRQGAVDTLVMDNDFNAEGWRCTEDLAMIGDAGVPETCPAGEGQAEGVDLREAMVAVALKTGAYVEFVDGSDALKKAGGVAGLLRWRPDNLPGGVITSEDLATARS